MIYINKCVIWITINLPLQDARHSGKNKSTGWWLWFASKESRGLSLYVLSGLRCKIQRKVGHRIFQKEIQINYQFVKDLLFVQNSEEIDEYGRTWLSFSPLATRSQQQIISKVTQYPFPSLVCHQEWHAWIFFLLG